jgi:hypothetical protein
MPEMRKTVEMMEAMETRTPKASSPWVEAATPKWSKHSIYLLLHCDNTYYVDCPILVHHPACGNYISSTHVSNQRRYMLTNSRLMGMPVKTG